MAGLSLLRVIVLATAPAAIGAVDFPRDIQPVLRARCSGCHGAKMQAGGLRLDQREAAMRGGYSGAVIRPGDSAGSRLLQMVTAGVTVDGKRITMPPGGKLPEEEASSIRQWIDAGAPWPADAEAGPETDTRPRPWSFAPIRRPAVPGFRGWGRNPIDAFLLAKMTAEGWKPSPEAPAEVLVRRLYLDLTGIPPTPEQTAEFLADRRPDAYERLVDRLFQSPHYGEKWARQWLDVARYADSEGGIQDYLRPYAWRYRQWVVEAMNRDMPFDQFTIEQVAGDLLPGSTVDQKIATGFLRNTITSREGGIDLNRLRFDQLIDRASTVGAAWLGLTVGCAQCHDHKYDPISQKDFYRFVAYFESSEEEDIDAPLAGEREKYRQYSGVYEAERARLLESHGLAPLQAEWEENLRFAASHPGKRTDLDSRYDGYSKQVDHGLRILTTDPAKRTLREQESVTNYFLKVAEGVVGKEVYQKQQLKKLTEDLAKLREKYPPLSQVMTLRESAERPQSFLRIRGNFEDKGIAVTPGPPEAVPPRREAGDRLALARWLVAPENPLTARVAVNRFWQELFGRGLVRTSDDFGMQGDPPSHPELLDWLASEFRERGWSMKWIQRLMVTSAAYRQSSYAGADALARDPGNVLLARQTRMRLPAELIRDAALSASGLLQLEVGGESIRPPQPEGVADLSYSFKWTPTEGPRVYRRGLYVHVQRTALYPLLMSFDAPDRMVSCARREVSNTPLQALNLMNDPVFTEAARALAARIRRETGDAERLERAFAICYSRKPTAKERDLLLSYLERRRQISQGDDGEAWFGLSRALLNSDEFLHRP